MDIYVLGPDKSFVRRDVNLLRSLGHNVRTDRFDTTVDVVRALSRSRVFDCTILWCAGYGSARFAGAPRAFRSKAISIIAGGEAYAAYGSALNSLTKRTLDNVEGACFVSKHLVHKAMKNGLTIPKNFCVSSPPIDSEAFKPGKKEPKTAAMIVGVCKTPRRLLDKGVDRLLNLAASNPDWHFELLRIDPSDETGMRYSEIEAITGYKFPSNVQASIPSDAVLRNTLSYTDVILSLSRVEGLSNALMEGMLSGCIPLVTSDVHSSVEAANTSSRQRGHVLFNCDNLKESRTLSQIMQGFDADDVDREICRDYAKKMTSPKQREIAFDYLFRGLG